MVSTNFFIVACQDHGFAAREFGGKHPVEAFAIGAVQGSIGLIKKNQRSVIGKDRTKLGELQLRPCEVKGVRVGVVRRIRPPLPYRGMNHLVRRVMQSKRGLMVLFDAPKKRCFAAPISAPQPQHPTLARGKVYRADTKLWRCFLMKLPPGLRLGALPHNFPKVKGSPGSTASGRLVHGSITSSRTVTCGKVSSRALS